MIPSNAVVVLFDGVCNLCNGTVQFIIKRDAKGVFRFASLQSAYGQQQLKSFGLPSDTLYSIVAVYNGKAYQQSDAVLLMLKHLGGRWSWLTIFRILPRFFRDAVYAFIARNRYRFFGKKDQCMIPTPGLKSRFIE